MTDAEARSRTDAAPTGDVARRRLIYACFAASGTAGLVLQIVWSKYLSLLSGNSIYGVSTVVAAFLGGLGIGAWIGGRMAGRAREPLLVYARLEAAVAVLALASPLAFVAAKPLLAALYGATGGSGAVFLGVRFAILFAALLPPTIAMGASLPLVSADFARRGASFGASVGRLYAWNTAGAVLGVVLAGFAFIPLLGLWKSAAIAAVIDFAVAFAIWKWRPAAPPDVVPETAEDARRDVPSGASAAFARIVLPLFAVSGFTAILYEVAWTRVLAVPLGGMVYSFAAILAVYLAGLALGAGAASRLANTPAPPVMLFGVCQVLIAGVVVAGGHLFGWIPARMATLVADAADSPVSLLFGELGIVAVVVLPAAVLSGALFPLAAAIHQRGRVASRAPGAAVGEIYAANTVGSIAGAVLTGFVLIPWMGSLASILAASAVNLAIGLAALALSEWTPVRRGLTAAFVAGAAAVVLLLALPAWPAHRMTVGFARLVRGAVAARSGSGARSVLETVDAQAGERLVFYREGRVASVAVTESGGDSVLVVNGKPDASTGSGSDMMTQVVIGQLPLLVAPAAKDVCIVGYGSGVTTHAVLTHPVTDVLTIELEPAVIEAAPWFRGGAFEPLADPRSRLLVEDAGTFLRSSAQRFDVVVSEPSNPWVAGVGDLFTSEFYDEAAARVKPGGVFTQWVQCYEISAATQSVILRTLAGRFPEGHVFFLRAASDMVIVASPDRELVLDPAAMRAAFERAGPKADLARVGIDSVGDLMRCYAGRLSRLAARAGEGPVNTDDNGWLEHHAPLDVLRGGWRAEFGTPEEIGADLARSLGADVEAAARLCVEGAERSIERADAEPAAMFAAALERLGRGEADDLRRRAQAIPARVAAMKEASQLCAEALALMTRAAQTRDGVASRDAIDKLTKATRLHPANGQIAWRLGTAYVMVGRVGEAIAELRRAIGLIPATTQYAVRNDLAGALLMKRDFAACLAEAQEIERMKPGSAEASAWRIRVHHAQGERDAAREELRRGLAADPTNPRLAQIAKQLGE